MNKQTTFADDLAFLRKHGEPVVLHGERGARIVVSPEYQGRVMTSAVGEAEVFDAHDGVARHETEGERETDEQENAFEAAGMKQERRALRLRPQEFVWEWQGDDVLELAFALPPGAYATTVLAEVGDFGDVD